MQHRERPPHHHQQLPTSITHPPTAWLLHRRVYFSTRVRLLRQLDDATLQRLLGDVVPQWALGNDWERVESLNTAIAALWQPLNDTVFTLVGGVLEGALRQVGGGGFVHGFGGEGGKRGR